MRLATHEILVLRNVREDMTSHGGFVWPESGPVTCDEWQDTDECGHGLHGLPWGAGGSYWYDEPSKWLVVKVDTTSNYRHGTGYMMDKCKFRCGEVVYCGDRPGAIALIAKYAPVNTPINFLVAEAGNDSTQTAGYDSTQTAGIHSTQTAGYHSTQTAGYNSTQTAGVCSTQTAGYNSTQTAGVCSTQTAGYHSTQTAGDRSTQKAGIHSTQTIRWWDGQELRVKVRIITEAEADKWYRFEDGDWRLCNDTEIAEAENKLKDGDE